MLESVGIRGCVEESVVVLDGVTKGWVRGARGRERGGELEGIDGVTMRVNEGEFVCICGPSGCGKTTVLNLVAGLEEATGGEVRVRGERVKGPGIDRIVMFQESGIFPWLTVRENVEFPLVVAGMKESERREKVEKYLKKVMLWRYRECRSHELSGGMKQRVALARALIAEPSILLMDEPFAALDPVTREALYGELERVSSTGRKTVLFVTHDLTEAVRLGDRVVVMATRPGRVKCDFRITLARPRTVDDPEVLRVVAMIEAALGGELERVIEEERDDAKGFARAGWSRTGDGGLGHGVGAV